MNREYNILVYNLNIFIIYLVVQQSLLGQLTLKSNNSNIDTIQVK